MAIPSGNKILKPHEAIIAIGVGCLAFALILYFAGHWELTKDKFLGEPAPEIEFQTKTGKQGSLSQHKGAVILINFWASWCAPCMEEMPQLKMLEEHLRDKGFVLLAFNIEGEEGDSVGAKIANSKLPRNLVFNFSKEQLKSYQVDGIPLSVLINKKGRVAKVYQGAQDWMDLSILREIEKLIRE
jgi:thiol-disulfide isomerase/thioredoxin